MAESPVGTGMSSSAVMVPVPVMSPGWVVALTPVPACWITPLRMRRFTDQLPGGRLRVPVEESERVGSIVVTSARSRVPALVRVPVPVSDWVTESVPSVSVALPVTSSWVIEADAPLRLRPVPSARTTRPVPGRAGPPGWNARFPDSITVSPE